MGKLKYIKAMVVLWLQLRFANPLKLILGAGATRYAGWIASDYPTFDITKERHWKFYLFRRHIDNLLAEHVLEHLTNQECDLVFTMAYKYLRGGGRFRIAVPDGNRKDSFYSANIAPPGDGHKQLFNVDRLSAMLTAHGFKVVRVEYFDEHGVFYHFPWDIADGKVMRSFIFDRQESFKSGNLYYTSLIVDAIR